MPEEEYYEVELECAVRARIGIYAEDEDDAREIAEAQGCELSDLTEIIESSVIEIKQGGF